MDKKYDRVATGGVFHLPTAHYSEETRGLIKVMMEECQLSMLKRRELERFIAGGEPLPSLQQKSSRLPARTPARLPPPLLTRRRSWDTIVQSGAFQRDQRPPTIQGRDGQQEKLKLQQMMAHGTMAPQSADRTGKTTTCSVQAAAPHGGDRFEELVEEIRDRYRFLSAVAELGQEQRYRSHIEAEIAAKLRAIQALDPRRSELVRRQLAPLRSSRGRVLARADPLCLR